jgi:hypothetical protein
VSLTTVYVVHWSRASTMLILREQLGHALWPLNGWLSAGHKV